MKALLQTKLSDEIFKRSMILTINDGKVCNIAIRVKSNCKQSMPGETSE